MIKLSRLRTALGLEAKDDANLTAYRAKVVSLWERATGLKWDERTGFVETIETEPRTVTLYVWLSLQQVGTISKVEVRNFSDSDWEELDTSSTERYLILGQKLRRLNDRWKELVRVTYDGGFAEAPEDIQQALIIQIKFELQRLADEKLASKAENFGKGSVGFLETASWHPYFAKLVKQYRKKAN